MPTMPDPVQHNQRRKLLKFFEPSLKQHPEWPVIVSEGDSWFSFPIHANLIDHLDEMAQRRINLLRLESSGDKALQIIGGKQKAKLAKYLKRYPVQALLFSGGGNDVVGRDLLPLLNQRETGMTWRQCINEETTQARFSAIRSTYLDLVHLRNENKSQCRLYIHSYDWAIPSGRTAGTFWGLRVGPWMKPYLEQKGIEEPTDQGHIIRFLLATFHEMLEEIAEKPGVVLVPTHGTLEESDWNDELHPTRRGFEKLAEKFRAELRKQFPGTF
ncbi:MAG: hypothetical protein SX243_12110 [Acidobacteriota bacterium]|nr:hypothetical protein [Acidobacteriota bacterium]